MEHPIMTQVLTLDQCPPDVRAHFLGMPAFNQAMRITKSTSVDTGTVATVTKTLKTSRPQHVKKSTPSFASILRGSPAHKAESAAPKAISSSPSKPVAPGMSIFKPADPSAPAKALPKANNTPKVPSKHDPVTFASLQKAIDTAMAEQRQREQSERFNAGRSAFSRIHKSNAPDTPSGTGSAWALRILAGRLAASVLNASTRKGDNKPVGSSALDVAFGRGR